jgi:hypothetical protein
MNESQAPARRPAQAPPRDTVAQRRLKLVVFILILVPMALFAAYHLTVGAIKIFRGEPVGYQQRDHRTGEIR